MRVGILYLLALALAAPCAFAVDGVVLINQSTVMAAGGFPYTISQPGSYKLSGNLQAPAGSNGIVIAASNVTLDLNGFTIFGSSIGLGTGVLLSARNSPKATTVRNGTISGNGLFVDLEGTLSGTVLENLTLIDLSGGGDAEFGGSVIVRRVFFPTGEIAVGCQALVVDSVAGLFHRNTAPSTLCPYTFGFITGPVL